MVKKGFKRKKLKSAIVFGSSGLIGKALVKQLLSNPNYGEVLCFNRQKQNISDPKYKEVIDDLTDLKKLSDFRFGDEVFCCLGTTIKKAGTKAHFEKVDHDLPLEIAKLAEKKKVKHFLVVSSMGSKAESNNFYLRTKGRMEEAVKKLNIPQITIVRPSMLLGNRSEFRFGEEIGKVGMKIFKPLLSGRWKKYRAIHVDDVSSAMVIIANSSPTSQVIFESNELQEIADAES